MLGSLRHSWRHAGCPMRPYTAAQLADLQVFGKSWTYSSSSSSILAPAASCNPPVNETAESMPSHAHNWHRASHSPSAAGACSRQQQTARQPASPTSNHARAARLGAAARQLPASMPQQSAILGSCHHMRWRGSIGTTQLLSSASGPMHHQPAGLPGQPARRLATVRKPSPAQRQAQRDRQVCLYGVLPTTCLSLWLQA